MIKSCNIRDYATAAFRFYAALGKIGSEEIKERIKNIIYEQSKREFCKRGSSGGHSDSVAYAVEKAEREIEDFKADIEDIIAVEKTLKQLDIHTKRIIEIVYFADSDKPLRKNDISDRVHKAVFAIPMSERQIYYRLKRARLIFARERGLRIEEIPAKMDRGDSRQDDKNKRILKLLQ